jgi:NAD(P)-dependent dehydrogenase (short-subunit alcohol dehydrogenase family)
VTYPPAPITDFSGLVAVVTGGGTGMGRELVRQLTAAGCHVAMCDVDQEAMDETSELAFEQAVDGVRVSSFVANVADAAAMDAFADHVRSSLETPSISLLFNNAGIAGAGSFVKDNRADWDRVFAVTWGGVLNGMRSFLPMLMASDRGHVINTSSINGMWACLGPVGANTAYSAAKFAVKGLTESLNVDFRVNAPHLTASVVMPGHIGTKIALHSMIEMGLDPKNMTDEAVTQLRLDVEASGIDLSGASDEDIRTLMQMRVELFENAAPTSAAQAATIILDAVKAGEWRVLVGPDAEALDRRMRERPGEVYTDEFMDDLQAAGHFTGGGLIQR